MDNISHNLKPIY